MAVGNANKAYLGIGEETIWGTSVARAKYLEMNREFIGVEESPNISPSLYSAGILSRRRAQGGVSVGGSFEFNPQYGGMEKLWRAALHGVPITSQPDVTSNPTVYQHVFTVRDILSPYSLTLEIERDIAKYIVTGAKIAAMQWAVRANELMVCTAEVIAKDVTTGSGGTPAFSSSPLILGAHAALTWGGTQLDVEQATIKIDNGLGGDRRFIGSRYISEPVREGKITVGGSFVVEFSSQSQYDDFRAATSRALLITCTGATITGVYAYLFTLNCPVTYLDQVSPTADGQGRMTVEVPFSALRNDSGNELTLTARNTESAV
jgi:hypothetical protein